MVYLVGVGLFGWRWFVWFTFVWLALVYLVRVGLFGSRWFVWFTFVWLALVCLVGVGLFGSCWYHETRKGSGKYVPSAGTVNIDKKFVHVSSCLGLVDLVWSNNVYTMKDNGQMERFIRLMRTIS